MRPTSGEKQDAHISETRAFLSEATHSHQPQHDIYSIEDLKTLIAAIHEATEYSVPVG